MAVYGPVLAVDDIVEVTTYCKANDQLGLNVFHYKVTQNALNNSLGRVVESLEGGAAAASATLRSLMPTICAFAGWSVRIYNPGPSILYYDTTGIGAGTVTGDLLPRQCAGLISKRVNVAGRRKGGRFYMPFPGELDNAETSIPTDGYLARLGDLAAELLGALTDSGGNILAVPVVAKKTIVAGVTNISTTRQIIAMNPKQKWATQRRRGSFGRTNVSPF